MNRQVLCNSIIILLLFIIHIISAIPISRSKSADDVQIARRAHRSNTARLSSRLRLKQLGRNTSELGSTNLTPSRTNLLSYISKKPTIRRRLLRKTSRAKNSNAFVNLKSVKNAVKPKLRSIKTNLAHRATNLKSNRTKILRLNKSDIAINAATLSDIILDLKLKDKNNKEKRDKNKWKDRNKKLLKSRITHFGPDLDYGYDYGSLGYSHDSYYDPSLGVNVLLSDWKAIEREIIEEPKIIAQKLEPEAIVDTQKLLLAKEKTIQED